MLQQNTKNYGQITLNITTHSDPHTWLPARIYEIYLLRVFKTDISLARYAHS